MGRKTITRQEYLDRLDKTTEELKKEREKKDRNEQRINTLSVRIAYYKKMLKKNYQVDLFERKKTKVDKTDSREVKRSLVNQQRIKLNSILKDISLQIQSTTNKKEKLLMIEAKNNLILRYKYSVL